MAQPRSRFWRRLLGGVAALVIAGGGCDADPMPSPGLIAGLRVIISTVRTGPSDVGIIGLQSAAPGAGIVVIRAPQAEVEATSTAQGTFAAEFLGAPGDQVSITFKQTEFGPESKAVVLTVPTATGPTQSDTNTAGEGAAMEESPAAPTQTLVTGGGAPDGGSEATEPADAGLPGSSIADAGTTPTQNGTTPLIFVSAPNGAGDSSLTGAGFVPGDAVIVGNIRTGEEQALEVAGAGTIAGSIGAMDGDTLVVIVQAPGGATSETSQVSVP